MKRMINRCMWMLAGLMLAGITACSDADSELGTVASQSEGKTRAYDYSCTLTVEEPGTLGTLLEQQMGEDAGNVQELIVSGVYSETDAEYVRNNLGNTLLRVDLSGVTQFLEKNEYYDYENGYWTYDWVDNHRLLNGCFSFMYELEEVILPENVITEIGSSSFQCCSSLTQVTIPESVISLGSYIFYNDTNDTALESLEILGNITEIPDFLCYGCSKLKELKFPDSVHSMGIYAFYDCSLIKDFTLFSGVDSFAQSCFAGCGFEEVDLSNLTEIPSYMFQNCSSLKNVTFSPNLKEIGEHAFENCAFQSLSLPDKVESVGRYCFSSCSELEEIDISNLTSISVGLFYGCSALKDVKLSPDLIGISMYAFKGTGIKTIALPNSLTVIGYEAFCESSLEEIELPSSLSEIYGFAFRETPLRSITIPENVTFIDTYDIFKDCWDLTAIYWDNQMDATYLGGANENCILYLHTYNGIAPAYNTGITNVVIDDVAETIVLKPHWDFNCARPFIAKKISYTIDFNSSIGWTVPGMISNWYTITLPFKPTKISHSEKGLLAPFNSDVEDAKPFWLRELNGDDFEDVTSIEPHRPYIISMPYNPDLYLDEYNIIGDVTFEAENVEIGVTPELMPNEGTNYSMWPNYLYKSGCDEYYGLMAYAWDSSVNYHSSFFQKGEAIYPFQAYVTSATARSIISMDGKRAATRVASDDPRLKHPGKPRIDDI